ncbi:MAG TPA: hypothetical protein DCZ43_01495, partial [candidate division Zixibacteria bacterium]|nr:hypothetical protein [candidate division Zixibacteria bacterium]
TNAKGPSQPAINYYLLGPPCSSIISADLNSDGYNDLAVSQTGPPGEIEISGVSVLINNNDGAFGTPIFYNAPLGSGSVVASDLDNDGDKDLVTANFYSNNISVLRNLGDGTFEESINYAVGGEPSSVFAIDADGDGDNDVVTANLYSYTISFLKNNGGGIFVQEIDYPVGNYPISIIASDFNEDGDKDLAVLNGDFALNYRMSIMMNAGNGFFEQPVNYTINYQATSLVAADLDNDGDNDIAVTKYSGYVTIFINDGSGFYQVTGDYQAGSFPSNICAADIDGDGYRDLAVTNESSDSISILINGGDGAFENAIKIRAGDGPISVLAADFDDDGDNDLAVANNRSNDIFVWSNNGDGTFQTPIIYPIGRTLLSLSAADLNNDGHLDLIASAGTGYPRGGISLFFNNGDGTFSPGTTYEAGFNPNTVVAANLDNDGDNDLAVVNLDDNNISILQNNGGGVFQAIGLYGTGGYPSSAAIADFDSDGDNDIAVGNSASQTISIMTNRTILTAIDDQQDRGLIRGYFSISQNYPNPFNAQTSLSYSLPQAGPVKLSIYNLLGQKAATLLDAPQTAGEHSLIWNASPFPSGIYFARLDMGNDAQIIKLVLLK